MKAIKKILNPIQHFSEFPILIFGILISAISIIMCFLWSLILDGYLDIHETTFMSDGSKFSFWDYASIYGLIVVAMLLPMMIVGLIINKKSRFIDILNSVLISRWPLMLAIPVTYVLSHTDAVVQLTNQVENLENLQELKLNFLSIATIIIYAVILILLLVMHIFTFFYSFSTAVHVKVGWHKVAFFVALLIGEILSKYIITHFYF